MPSLSRTISHGSTRIKGLFRPNGSATPTPEGSPVSHATHVPHAKADIISAMKPTEEETLPKYCADTFYPAKVGELMNNRYRVIAKLGYGMTATVWLARDSKAPADAGNKKYVVVKVSVNTLTENFWLGRQKIGQRILTANPKHPGYNHVRSTLDWFFLRSKGGEHLCIVHDVLREPVDSCMTKFASDRFSSSQLRVLLPPILQGLDYLHTECHVVHTDLKPDNIMMGLGDPDILDKFAQRELERPSPHKMADHSGRIIYQSRGEFGDAPTDAIIASAKITDLGLAVFGDQKNTRPIQANAFTAPEVLLGCAWSYPADIWNLGVMLWDLIESFGLFDRIDTVNNYKPAKHLGLMIALLGPPPRELLKRGSKTGQFFEADGTFRFPQHVQKDFSFEYAITRMQGENKELFIDFAQKMICWLPEERWTAQQLSEHPWLYARPVRINGCSIANSRPSTPLGRLASPALAESPSSSSIATSAIPAASLPAPSIPIPAVHASAA